MSVEIFTGSPKRVKAEMKEFLETNSVVITHMSQSSNTRDDNGIVVTLIYTFR